MKKRISALLLSVVLCLAMLSTAALGADNNFTITARGGDTAVSIQVEGLRPGTYNMCAVSREDELLALFNAEVGSDGVLTATVTTGTLQANDLITVSIPNPTDADSPITGNGTVEEAPVDSHTITATAGAGGSITPSGDVTVADGGEQNFTIRANAGYSISGVTVDGASQGALGAYRFANVTMDHTIHATFSYNGGGGDGGNSGNGGGGSGGGGGGGGGSSSSSKAPDVSKNDGGSVKVSSDGKTVTITPNQGYRVKDVIVNGQSVGAVTKYVFDKASKDNTVKVVFEKIEGEDRPNVTAPQFTDVSGHWAGGAISFVVERGLFHGVSNTRFGPNEAMTRAMLVTVLHRLEGQPAGGSNSFADVPAGQWYTQAVAWAASQGVVQGTEKGFDPNGNITREQLATILYRYAALKGALGAASGDMSRFPDAGSVSAWAAEAMNWAVGAGILGGTDAGTLNPGGNASRAEVATMLMRLVEFMG